MFNKASHIFSCNNSLAIASPILVNEHDSGVIE